MHRIGWRGAKSCFLFFPNRVLSRLEAAIMTTRPTVFLAPSCYKYQGRQPLFYSPFSILNMRLGCALKLKSQSVRTFCSNLTGFTAVPRYQLPTLLLSREFRSSARLQAVKPFLLADIGEGSFIYSQKTGGLTFDNIEYGNRDSGV